ncbi:MAG: glycosyltransferase family 9 protein, partial [Chloroflexota bacterium]|nr:glycosyltransferase family 9 protein [Chloroflexota bacterium]
MFASITLVRAGALGDTVLTLPAVQALRDSYPKAHLTVIGYPASWEIAGSMVHEVLSVDRADLAGLLTGTPVPALISRLALVDLLVLWTQQDRASMLRPTAKPETVSASPYPPPGVHASAWLLQTLALPDDTLADFQLTFDGAERAEATSLLRALHLSRPVILHPGAGAHWKRWPGKRFAALADTLERQGRQVLLVEGPADVESIEAVQAHASRPYPVLRETSPRRLAALLSQGSLFIGNDSGVTHLAAISGIPTIALFGPTDPANWAPLGTSRVVRSCLARATYQGQIRVCDDPTCMSKISV